MATRKKRRSARKRFRKTVSTDPRSRCKRYSESVFCVACARCLFSQEHVHPVWLEKRRSTARGTHGSDRRHSGSAWGSHPKAAENSTKTVKSCHCPWDHTERHSLSVWCLRTGRLCPGLISSLMASRSIRKSGLLGKACIATLAAPGVATLAAPGVTTAPSDNSLSLSCSIF